jgi:cytochrome c biogenesis protein ResB
MKKLIHLLGSIKVTVACLFILCLLTLFGTLYQKEYGLFLAQERFFYSWFLLAGGVVPLPGGLLVMGVLTVNLFISFFVHYVLGPRFIGVWLVHLGLLLMLGGGAYTMLTGKSGYVFLFEGESTNVLTHYHEWELAVWPAGEGPRAVEAVDVDVLNQQGEITFPTSGLAVKVETFHPNADAYLRTDKPVDPGLESASNIVEVRPLPPPLEPERNLPALIAAVSRDGQTRRLLFYGADEKAAEWKVGDTPWQIRLQRRREELPVRVALHDFKREAHPNSGVAKSFSSDIAVTFPNGVERDVVVEMNQPFRHDGYTFYQASFSEDGRTQGSKFAVTYNRGRLLPYVATALTTLGLIVHFGIQMARMAREQRRRPA